MLIRATATHVVPRSPDTVYDLAAGPANLARIFVGYGPIPGIRSAAMMDGRDVAAGNVIRFEDVKGGVLFHRIDRLERGVAYEYDLHGLTAPFSLLVRSGYARWRFEREGEGTRVTWDYEFPLRSLAAYPLARLLIGVFMRRAMQRCLGELERLAAA